MIAQLFPYFVGVAAIFGFVAGIVSGVKAAKKRKAKGVNHRG